MSQLEKLAVQRNYASNMKENLKSNKEELIAECQD